MAVTRKPKALQGTPRTGGSSTVTLVPLIYAILSLANDVQLRLLSQSSKTRDSPFEVASSGSATEIAKEAVIFPSINFSKSVLEV